MRLHEEGKKLGFELGLQQGKQDGIQEGMKKNRQENARRMLAKNYPLDDIAMITGLSESEIKALRDGEK